MARQTRETAILLLGWCWWKRMETASTPASQLLQGKQSDQLTDVLQLHALYCNTPAISPSFLPLLSSLPLLWQPCLMERAQLRDECMRVEFAASLQHTSVDCVLLWAGQCSWPPSFDCPVTLSQRWELWFPGDSGSKIRPNLETGSVRMVYDLQHRLFRSHVKKKK